MVRDRPGKSEADRPPFDTTQPIHHEPENPNPIGSRRQDEANPGNAGTFPDAIPSPLCSGSEGSSEHTISAAGQFFVFARHRPSSGDHTPGGITWLDKVGR